MLVCVCACVCVRCFETEVNQMSTKRRMWEAAKKPEFKLNLADLIKFGRDADKKTLLMSAMFLQKELPIRIGKRVQELQSLPVPMYSTNSVRELAQLYEETFFRVVNHDAPNNSKSEESFSEMLLNVREKHKEVQANIAGGFTEMLRAGVPKWALESQEIQDKLDRFYTGRYEDTQTGCR
jgi:pyruvate dehydrogenase kinase 2/3/4